MKAIRLRIIAIFVCLAMPPSFSFAQVAGNSAATPQDQTTTSTASNKGLQGNESQDKTPPAEQLPNAPSSNQQAGRPLPT